MRAIVRAAGRVRVTPRPPPPLGPRQVRIAIRAAGVCRTDLRVARGELPSADPVVLGHELAGEVTEVGSGVTDLQPGDRVSADPRVGCGCGRGCSPTRCTRPTRLGIEVDGVFAEQVVLPEHVVVRTPTMPWRHLAMVEPVAAALATCLPGLHGRGRVLGSGRFATLTERVMVARGLDVHSAPPAAGYDYVVETHLDQLPQAIEQVRCRGTVIVKSRTGALSLPVDTLQRRRLRLEFVRYGSFTEAASLLASGRVEVDDLLAPPMPLEAFPGLVEEALTTKVLLIP